MIKENYEKEIHVMCEDCYNVIKNHVRMYFDKPFNVNPEFNIDFGEYYWCDNCKDYKLHVEIDPNMSELVSTLNKHGVITKFCCQGHVRVDKTKEAYENGTDEVGVYLSHPYLVLVDDFSTNKLLLEKLKTFSSDWITDTESLYDRLNSYTTLRFNMDIIDKIEDEEYSKTDLYDYNFYSRLAYKEQKAFDKKVKELHDLVMKCCEPVDSTDNTDMLNFIFKD